MPTPQRTDSGHRLYSQYDIDTLKSAIKRQDEGMSISHAIELLEPLERGQKPLRGRRYAGDAAREHALGAAPPHLCLGGFAPAGRGGTIGGSAKAG